MITSLLLAAALLAAPAPAQTAGQTTAAPAGKSATAPAAKPASKPASKAAAKPPAKPAAAPADAAAAAVPGPEAPKGLVIVETRRGKLEFSHKTHAQTACVKCHVGQAPPARIGVKGVEAAHKFCVDCHKAGKKGPEKCSWCHKRS